MIFLMPALMLPAVYENTTDIGRATKGAAFGLLAKVYLTLKRYNETLVAIDSVMNLGVYSLNRKYELEFQRFARKRSREFI